MQSDVFDSYNEATNESLMSRLEDNESRWIKLSCTRKQALSNCL